MRYSAMTGCFYPEDIPYQELPSDLIEVSESDFADAMARKPGETLAVSDGRVLVMPAVEPSVEEVSAKRANSERYWRNGEMRTTDVLVLRHRDQLEFGSAPMLSPDQYQELQAYRCALRNWPADPAFPDPAHRPEPPAWLANEDTH